MTVPTALRQLLLGEVRTAAWAPASPGRRCVLVNEDWCPWLGLRLPPGRHSVGSDRSIGSVVRGLNRNHQAFRHPGSRYETWIGQTEAILGRKDQAINKDWVKPEMVRLARNKGMLVSQRAQAPRTWMRVQRRTRKKAFGVCGGLPHCSEPNLRLQHRMHQLKYPA